MGSQLAEPLVKLGGLAKLEGLAHLDRMVKQEHLQPLPSPLALKPHPGAPPPLPWGGPLFKQRALRLLRDSEDPVLPSSPHPLHCRFLTLSKPCPRDCESSK